MKKITINEKQLLGKGGTANVYRVDSDKLLKLYKNEHTLEEIQLQKDIDRAATVAGIPCAISYDIVECDGQYGIIYEILSAPTTHEALVNFPDQREEYIKKYASLLKDLHEISIPNKPFVNKKVQKLASIERLKPYTSDEEYSLILNLINNIPESDTFVHGDYNLNNVMNTDKGALVIDLADCGYSHPIFDLATVHLWLIDMAPFGEEFMLSNTGLTVAEAKNLWKVFINEYFNDASADEIMQYENNIKVHAALSFIILSELMFEAQMGPNNVAELVKTNLMPLLNAGYDKILF